MHTCSEVAGPRRTLSSSRNEAVQYHMYKLVVLTALKSGDLAPFGRHLGERPEQLLRHKAKVRLQDNLSAVSPLITHSDVLCIARFQIMTTAQRSCWEGPTADLEWCYVDDLHACMCPEHTQHGQLGADGLTGASGCPQQHALICVVQRVERLRTSQELHTL